MSDPFWRIGSADDAATPQGRGRGRDALFSDSRRGRLRLRCERCGIDACPGPRDLLRGVPWLLAPRLRHPLRGRCPVCRRRAWLSVRAGARSSSVG